MDQSRPKPGKTPVVARDPAAADRAAALREQERARKNSVRQTKAAQTLADRPEDARLAQVINLHIAGYSVEHIAHGIGATVDEVDSMLNSQMTRYIKSQPALRTYVRNWISNRYAILLDAVWDNAAGSPGDPAKGIPPTPVSLEHQDRALRILKEVGRLHGAEAPSQAEVKVESTPATVQAMVDALSAQSGLGYTTDVFDTDDGDEDVVDAEIVEPRQLVDSTAHDLEVSGNEIEEN